MTIKPSLNKKLSKKNEYVFHTKQIKSWLSISQGYDIKMKTFDFCKELGFKLRNDLIEEYDTDIEISLYSLLLYKENELPELDRDFHKNIRMYINNEKDAPIYSAIWHLLHKSQLFWDVANDLGLIKYEN